MDDRTDFMPCVTPDGRYIVFVSERKGTYNIWRMDADGSHPKQLTQGSNENWPSLTSDGQWVIYWGSSNKSKTTLWKVPIEGGEPVPLSDTALWRPIVSPDGKLIAGYVMDDQTAWMWLSVIPVTGGTPTRLFKVFPIPTLPMIRWNADSRALTYIASNDRFANIWSLPVNSSQPRQLTNFQSDRIFRFAWSVDGKRLAYERGMIFNDIILINDFN